MARRDVPYPGGRCSLKCELENLWCELRAKLKSINGVPGDGTGDVKLKAGANVTITNDAAHNEITISAEDAVGIAKINGVGPDSSGDFSVDVPSTSILSVVPITNGIGLDQDVSGLATKASVDDIISGDTRVGEATHQTGADYATNAGHQTSADSQTTAGSANSAGSQTSAGEAAKLSTARTIQTDLGSSVAASFDGSQDITPGVSGILPIQNGGTGSNVQNFVGLTGDQQSIQGYKWFDQDRMRAGKAAYLRSDTAQYNRACRIFLGDSAGDELQDYASIISGAYYGIELTRYIGQNAFQKLSLRYTTSNEVRLIMIKSANGVQTETTIAIL